MELNRWVTQYQSGCGSTAEHDVPQLWRDKPVHLLEPLVSVPPGQLVLAGFPHDAHAAHTSVGNAFRIAKPLVLVDRSVRFRERIRIAAFISETIGAQRMDTSFEMRISGFSNLRLQRVEQRSSACVVADADGLDQAIPSLEYERTAGGLQHVYRVFIALRRIAKPTCSAARRRERQQRLLHRSRRSL